MAQWLAAKPLRIAPHPRVRLGRPWPAQTYTGNTAYAAPSLGASVTDTRPGDGSHAGRIEGYRRSDSRLTHIARSL